MKYPLFKSLFALGTIILVCSCSDDKVSTSNGGDVNFVPCAAAWHVPSEDIVILQDYSVTDLNGNQIGTAVVNDPATPNIVFIMSSNGEIIVNQIDLNDQSKVKIIAGDATKCSTTPPDKPIAVDSTITTCESAWYLPVNDKKYLIYPDSTVTDITGNLVGSLAAIPNSTLVMVNDLNGAAIRSNVELPTLPVISGNGIHYKVKDSVFHLKNAAGDFLIYADGTVTDANGNTVGHANIETGVITGLDNATTITTANITTLPILQPGSKCADLIQTVVSSSSVTPPTPTSSSNVAPPSSSNATPKSSAAVVKSSSSQKKSSSSQAKSSSSQAKSSSSVATGGCPKIVEKNGGERGSGFASRYWDCCMPSCAWNENSGGNPTKTCDAKGKNNIGNGSGSVCSGGQGATCTSQIPFAVEGCEEYGFAFAAVPAFKGGSLCGRCFQLTFTGQGHYNSTNANTQKLKSKGKKLIVMATNIGGDVGDGQFDVLIPGGGVGMFNGCSQMGWGGQGEQYGGLLSDCEKETGYKAAQYGKCLTEKCNKAFGNDEEAKKGCMFLVEWMESAGNPEHNFVEVECPDVLKQRYK